MKNRQPRFANLIWFGVTSFLTLALGAAWYLHESARRVAAEFDQEIWERSSPRWAQIASLKDRASVDDWIERSEREVEKPLELRGASIKKNQRKGVEWAGTKLVTPLSIVYVHGFSASRLELDPVVSQVAKTLGANVFFTRLAAHGISDGEEFATVRARDWAVDVEEALAIGRKIGERVVVIAMSTGAPLVLENVLRHGEERNAKPAALILLSPNFEVKAMGAKLLEGPFGDAVSRLVIGDHREFKTENAMHAERWTSRYRVEGIAAMLTTLAYARSLDFSKIEIPVLTIYSRNDDVVDTRAIEARAKEINSPHSVIVALPDARRHELFSATFDADKIPVLRELMLAWLQEAL